MNWKARGRERVQRNLRQTDHKDFRHDIVGRDLNPEAKNVPAILTFDSDVTLYRDTVVER